jgi:hypothetical protein
MLGGLFWLMLCLRFAGDFRLEFAFSWILDGIEIVKKNVALA